MGNNLFYQVSFKVSLKLKLPLTVILPEERNVFENEAPQSKRASRNWKTKSYDLVSFS